METTHQEARLKVLIVAPPFLPISPKLKYAGTERVIAGINEVLSARPDVECIVAATGDSELEGRGTLIYTHPQALWARSNMTRKVTDPFQSQEKHIMFALRYAVENGVDIIHDHAGIIGSAAYEQMKDLISMPIVTTTHGEPRKEEEYKYEKWRQARREGRDVHFVSISDSQQRKFERHTGVRFTATAYNGVPVEKFPFVDREGRLDYLFWIGRICRDKGTDLAIKIAKAVGRPLIIAGEVHTNYQDYYRQEVKRHITHVVRGKTEEEAERNRDLLVEQVASGKRIVKPGDVLFIGPLDDRQKGIIYSRAQALLVPNRWEEPFGLVMPEAMATGTPVIGTMLGAIPEIVDSQTGYLLPVTWKDRGRKELDEEALLRHAQHAMSHVARVRPIDCRRRVERRFSIGAMAKAYLSLFNRMVKKETSYVLRALTDPYGTLKAIGRGPGALQRWNSALREELHERQHHLWDFDAGLGLGEEPAPVLGDAARKEERPAHRRGAR